MKSSVRGFTLIELLVVIALLAVLATIGVLVFREVISRANDAKIKADLNAIGKAYEIKYANTGTYEALTGSDFSDGVIPKMPGGGDYPCLIGPGSNCVTQATDRFATCIGLGSQGGQSCYAPSDTCQCSSSSEGVPYSGESGGGSSPSCDPYGVLTSGLVGYWKMDEALWNGTAGEVVDTTASNYHGQAFGGANTVAGKLGRAGSFDGVDNYVDLPTLPVSASTTVTGWFNYTAPSANRYLSILTNWWGTFGKIILLPGTQLRWQWIEAGGTTRVMTTGAVSAGNWHFFAATFNKPSTTAKLYLDGNTPMTLTANDIERSTNNLVIIGHDQATLSGGAEGLPFSGLIDDVRIYNRAISDSEVSALYNSGNGCAL